MGQSCKQFWNHWRLSRRRPINSVLHD